MFSTQENEYIRNMVISKYNENINNYLCKTITENDNYYDFVCYFTNNDITISNGHYVLNTGKSYTVDISSSTYNTATDKVVENDFTTISVVKNESEFYYSNTNSLVDITADIKYNELHNLSYNLDKNDFMLVLVLLIMPIVVGLVHHFFRID